MNYCSQLVLAAAVVLLNARAFAVAVSDITPPRVIAFDLSPSNIDASTNFQTITITARLTDDLSGLTVPEPSVPAPLSAFASFRSPFGGNSAPTLSVNLSFPGMISGNNLDLVCKGELIVPRYSHSGVWTLVSVDVTDLAGNVAHVSAADLKDLGLPFSFTVNGSDDRTPPDLVSLTLDPVTVDTSTGPQTLTVTARVREDLSGLGRLDQFGRPFYDFLRMNFASPSRAQQVFAAPSMQRISGDDHDGIYQTTLRVPQYSEPGTWNMGFLSVSDAVGNTQSILLGSAGAKGFTTTFTVTGPGDITPPTLLSFVIFPRRIDTSTNGQTITSIVRITDNLSGLFASSGSTSFIGGVSGTFQSPSRKQSASIRINPLFSETGSALDLVLTNEVLFPQFSETGVWTLAGLNIRDVAGNQAILDQSALRQLGFPTQLAVGVAPSLAIARQGDAILLSWPAWGSDFRLESRDVGASSDWKIVGISPATVGEQMTVSVPVLANSQFYRLSE
jgi:hypothetical protein